MLLSKSNLNDAGLLTFNVPVIAKEADGVTFPKSDPPLKYKFMAAAFISMLW